VNHLSVVAVVCMWQWTKVVDYQQWSLLGAVQTYVHLVLLDHLTLNYHDYLSACCEVAGGAGL
jgi:hypothetical protein